MAFPHLFIDALEIALLAAGLVALAFGLWLRKTAIRSLSWPRAIATIQRSVIRPRLASSGAAPHPRQTHTVEVAYTYEVNGLQRAGSRLQVGGPFQGTEAQARAKAAQFPAGARVEAAYNPQQPDFAILDHGSTRAANATFTIAAILLALALTLAVLSDPTAIRVLAGLLPQPVLDALRAFGMVIHLLLRL
ncbi:MAG: DUF3592 domain-containing protein [Proteobacteria bacterium]|nr:DUF3592 domain-containing protein [Pseudomonadota bacterium]